MEIEDKIRAANGLDFEIKKNPKTSDEVLEGMIK